VGSAWRELVSRNCPFKFAVAIASDTLAVLTCASLSSLDPLLAAFTINTKHETRRDGVRKQGIFGMLSLGGCSHQFSWPRRSLGGDYYQVCILCGDEYGYDWNAMRRLGRKACEPALKSTSAKKQAVRWSPRARRMRLSGPVRYREVCGDLWSDGELKNISKSGILFEGSCPVPEGAPIKVELEMPSEICGGSMARRVRCDARVVRTGAGVCAAKIFDYVFIDRIQVTSKWHRAKSFLAGFRNG